MNLEFVQALNELEKEKGVSNKMLLETIEAALLSAYRKNFGSAQNVRVQVEASTGKVKVFALKKVTPQVKDPKTEILFEEAQKINPQSEINETVEIEITPKTFGRIAAQTAKQVVVQRLREAERDIIYEEFAGRAQDLVTGTVQRQEAKNIYLDLGRAEAILPPSEQVPLEKYRPRERLKVYVLEVKKTTKGPQILVSRAHPGLVKRLFELEVPEIYDGVVEIKALAREPGLRTKIALYSRDGNVDPIGACVGQKGVRVQAVGSELRGEKIDLIRWDPNPAVFIAQALSPAKVIQVNLDEKNKVAQVIVPDTQLSLAIGKEGQNVRLAARLTGWKIDLKSESQVKAKEEQLESQAT